MKRKSTGSKRRGRATGVVPRLFRALGRGLVWMVTHPQPVAALAILAACGLGLWIVMTRSDAFAIADVQVPANSSLKVPESLRGQNLWAIDLDALAATLKSQQPYLKRVRAIRKLPTTLQIEVTERLPIAQVKVGASWYAVDGDGFILPGGTGVPMEGLIVIQGAEQPKAPLKVGRENPQERFQEALTLIERVRRARVLTNRRLTAVDVDDPNQLSLIVDGEIEIRCGSLEELAVHLERLKTVLKQMANSPLAVRYIDVRFQDPVIGPRT